MSGADCFHTLDASSRELDDRELRAYFDQAGDAKVCAPAQAFADNKAVIEKLCSETGKCDYETQRAMSRFFSNLNRFTSRARGFK